MRARRGAIWPRCPPPGCATQANSFEELLSNLYGAVEGCLSVDVGEIPTSDGGRVVEIAV